MITILYLITEVTEYVNLTPLIMFEDMFDCLQYERYLERLRPDVTLTCLEERDA